MSGGDFSLIKLMLGRKSFSSVLSGSVNWAPVD